MVLISKSLYARKKFEILYHTKINTSNFEYLAVSYIQKFQPTNSVKGLFIRNLHLTKLELITVHQAQVNHA